MFESLLKTQVQGVMGILGQVDGLAPTRSYIQVDRAGTSYDTATGTVTAPGTQFDDIPMVLARFDASEVDGNKIVVTDQKAIIASLDLPVTPRVHDKILQSDGRTFLVMDVGGVPGKSAWILQIRETET